MQGKKVKRERIHRKIRSRVFGTKSRPRLCVFRSNRHIYAQLIDDGEGKILLSVCDVKVKLKKSAKKTDSAREIGKAIAREAMAKKINSVVFDRGGFVFHGRVKAVADGAREGGLKF